MFPECWNVQMDVKSRPLACEPSSARELTVDITPGQLKSLKDYAARSRQPGKRLHPFRLVVSPTKMIKLYPSEVLLILKTNQIK